MSDYEYRKYREAREAYNSVSHALNTGGDSHIVGAVFAEEHPYLLGKLFTGVAYAILMRTYPHLCPEARETIFADEPHPEHDGRLSCGEVIGALRIFGVKRGDDVLAAREFWVKRVYNPLVPA